MIAYVLAWAHANMWTALIGGPSVAGLAAGVALAMVGSARGGWRYHLAICAFSNFVASAAFVQLAYSLQSGANAEEIAAFYLITGFMCVPPIIASVTVIAVMLASYVAKGVDQIDRRERAQYALLALSAIAVLGFYKGTGAVTQTRALASSHKVGFDPKNCAATGNRDDCVTRTAELNGPKACAEANGNLAELECLAASAVHAQDDEPCREMIRVWGRDQKVPDRSQPLPDGMRFTPTGVKTQEISTLEATTKIARCYFTQPKRAAWVDFCRTIVGGAEVVGMVAARCSCLPEIDAPQVFRTAKQWLERLDPATRSTYEPAFPAASAYAESPADPACWELDTIKDGPRPPPSPMLAPNPSAECLRADAQNDGATLIKQKCFGPNARGWVDRHGRTPAHFVALGPAPSPHPADREAPELNVNDHRYALSLTPDVSAGDAAGNTPLHYAQSDYTVSILTKAGADASRVNAHGESPVHAWIRRASENHRYNPLLTDHVIDLMLAGHWDINAATTDGKTVLHYLLEGSTRPTWREDLQAMNLLVARGADVKRADKTGVTIESLRARREADLR